MKTVQEISERLKGVNILQFMPGVAIANLDQDRYPGLMSRYLADDPARVNSALLSLGSMIVTEEKRHSFLNRNQSSPGLLLSTQHVDTTPRDPSPSPAPAPLASDSLLYPPSKGVAWRVTQQLCDTGTSCPHVTSVMTPLNSSSIWKSAVFLLLRIATCASRTPQPPKPSPPSSPSSSLAL